MTLAYCGPIARRGEPARGGFESANRRLIDDLTGQGLSVVELAYAPERKARWRQALAYGASFVGLAWRVATEAGRWDAFHITPLRRHFIYAELLLCQLARWRGAKLVVDLRAGAIAEDLNTAKPLRRRALKNMLRAADLITVEGEVYLQLVRPYSSDAFYLPNYVDASTVGAGPVAPSGRINLLFLGRIVPEKGIEVALDCVRALQAKGCDVELKVIGRGDDAYVAGLKAGSADLPVRWLGAIPHPHVPAAVADSHFFVFPTRHRGEGHSNALTEAMSQGIVPLVADNGFNRQVVAETGLVFDKAATGEDYAAAIDQVLAGGRWPALSAAARRRIAEQFTGERLVPALVARYRRMLAGKSRAAVEQRETV